MTSRHDEILQFLESKEMHFLIVSQVPLNLGILLVYMLCG